MKSTGVVRKIDDLGRVTIPKELRDTGDFKRREPVEFLVNEHGDIILRKYRPACIICGEYEDIKVINNKRFCIDCLSKIKITVEKDYILKKNDRYLKK